MIGTTNYGGLFGFNKPPVPIDFGRSDQMPEQSPMEPQEPFVFGAGGARLTPEDIAIRRKQAMQQIAGGMDYSPVASWSQGAARVAQALMGALDSKGLDKASAANAAESQAAIGALGTGGSEQSIAAILANPYIDDGVKEAAKLQWQATHRAPPAPHYWETNNGSLGVVGPDGKPQVLYQDPTPKITWLTAENPDHTKTLIPMGPNGPISEGGGQTSTVPRAPVGKLTPIGGAGSGPQTFR